MRINVAVPEDHVSKRVLDGVLEGVTRLNEELLEDGVVPGWDRAVKKGIKWKPEPPGQEHFDHAAKVIGRGWGDCDDLAPYAAAHYRVTGIDPDATAVVKRSGPNKWHAIVEHGDGTFSDPSREAGMGSGSGVNGAVLPPMAPNARGGSEVGAYVALPQLAVRPIMGRNGQPEAWQARADLPWHYEPGSSPADVAMVSLHRSPVASQAIVGACLGGVAIGEASELIDDDVLDRVEAIGDYVDGVPYEELVELYGEDHARAAQIVGAGFFKKIGRGFKKVVLPIARQVVKFIPGVGPVASTALDVTEMALKAGGKKKARARASARLDVPRVVRRAGEAPSDERDMMLGYRVRKNGRVYSCSAE